MDSNGMVHIDVIRWFPIFALIITNVITYAVYKQNVKRILENHHARICKIEKINTETIRMLYAVGHEMVEQGGYNGFLRKSTERLYDVMTDQLDIHDVPKL